MMKIPPTTAHTQKAFESIAASLTDEGVIAGAMFGMPSLKVAGKAFAGVFGDALVFKLAGDVHASAMALKGSALFDPSGMGRAMKEWVVVRPAHSARWPELAKHALAYVRAAEPKPKAAAKKR
jgi:hypothetical protein